MKMWVIEYDIFLYGFLAHCFMKVSQLLYSAFTNSFGGKHVLEFDLGLCYFFMSY